MKLYSMWFQGREKAPEMCRRIFNIWEHLHPDHEFHVLERDEGMARLEGRGLVLDGLPYVKISTLVRIDILAEQGGVWVDATALPTVSLDTWLFGNADSAGFFARRDPHKDCIVSNWFIYSKAGHPLAVSWRDKMFEYYSVKRRQMKGVRYWHCKTPNEVIELYRARNRSSALALVDRDKDFHNRFCPYFAMHYIFQLMLEKDAELMRAWQEVPALPAGNTTFLSASVRALGRKRVLACLQQYLDLASVHKLSHKKGDFGFIVDQVERNLGIN